MVFYKLFYKQPWGSWGMADRRVSKVGLWLDTWTTWQPPRQSTSSYSGVHDPILRHKSEAPFSLPCHISFTVRKIITLGQAHQGKDGETGDILPEKEPLKIKHTLISENFGLSLQPKLVYKKRAKSRKQNRELLYRSQT